MLVEGTNKRIYNIDSSIGLLVGGKIPDGRNIMNRARGEAEMYKKHYAVPISGNVLAGNLGYYMHLFTCYSGYRPFGAAGIMASHNEYDGYKLHMLEPSG